MSRWSNDESLSLRQAARQIVELIAIEAERGTMLPRDFNSIRKALVFGDGIPDIDHSALLVKAYAETNELETLHIVRSVVVRDEFRGGWVGFDIVARVIRKAFGRNPEKPVCLAAPKDKLGFYRKLGFIQMWKQNVPKELMGGRSMEEWLESDREWMMIPNARHLLIRQTKPGIGR